MLIPVVKELFDRLYQRRMLIRLVGVRFSHLIAGNPQLNMFEDSAETDQPLPGDGQDAEEVRAEDCEEGGGDTGLKS